MTTPTPPGGNVTGGIGGLIGNLLGGGTGTLGGTNVLQQSIDQLTNAVNNLSQQIGSLNLGGGGLGGNATRQQNAGNTTPFPRMQNQFQPQGGGGGQNLGGGNVSQPRPFGSFASQSGFAMTASAITQFGNQQMQNLLTLNQYATSSMLGMNTNGMSQAQAMRALYSQVGATPGNLNSLALSPTDAYGMANPLQQLGGTALFNRSSLGRAGFGAAAAFGISNPTLGATGSANLASALYSPQFSMQMLMMGYQPIRSMNGGAPMNAGQAAQSILKGMGISGMSPAQTFGNLASPKGQASLSYLFGSSGIGNQQAQQYLQTYAQLFSKGMSPTAATNLITQAISGSTSSMKSAQQKLNSMGVATSTNDIQALKNAQAVTTGRQGEYAGGFNTAIQDSTSLLESFNNALNKLLNGPLGSLVGGAGGFMGIMSGTNHAVGSLGTVGGLMTIGRMLGMGGGAGGAGAAGGGLAGLGGLAATLGPAALALAAGAGAWAGLTKGGNVLQSMGVHNVLGMGNSNKAQVSMLQSLLNDKSLSSTARNHIQHIIHLIDQGQSFTNAQIQHMAGIGGGAGSMAKTSQNITGGNNQLGGVSGAAKSAVGAARSQLGVPYAYGDELPGVGFDCSGLVQWAYKQAGVSLPRTSQAMWTALKNRRVGLNQVQEGDLVFAAGSDGTPSSPGHVGLMVSGRQLIQAPYTGQDVQLSGYDPANWMGAVRPSGRGSFISGGPGSSNSVSSTGMSQLVAGNRGLGGPGTNSYGSANEVDLISAMGGIGAAGGGTVGSLTGSAGNGQGGTANTNGTSGKSRAGSVKGIQGGGNISANKRLMQQMAQAMYGWGNGSQWNALNTLEMHEAGYNQFAQNPNSTAYGIGQFLDQTWGGFGPKTSDPKLQIQYMLEYIKGKYGTPVNAWNKYYQHPGGVGWYGTGGMLQPGMNVVGERGPEIALNSGGRTQIISNSQTSALINALKGNTPQSPWTTDITGGASAGTAGQRPLNINFNPGSIVIHTSGSSNESVASRAGREVARQIVKHINDEAISQAIRNGDKL